MQLEAAAVVVVLGSTIWKALELPWDGARVEQASAVCCHTNHAIDTNTV